MLQMQQPGTAPEGDTPGAAGDIPITTTPAMEGYHIVKYIEVVSAETVLGSGFFTELFTWIADKFSRESTAVERKICIAREMSLQKIREKALSVGANAIIGTSFACSSNSRSMISMIITGTAVHVEPVAQ